MVQESHGPAIPMAMSICVETQIQTSTETGTGQGIKHLKDEI